MKLLKTINKIIKKNIVWILFIVIIGFLIIQQFNLYEGILYVDGKDNTNTQKVVIHPFIENSKGEYIADYLHLSELVLYGDNGKIEYTALSSNGVYNDQNSYDKLIDSDKKTIFHSDKRNCVLTITPKQGSAKITKILIRNRLDCCLDRLKGYYIYIIRNDGSVFFSKKLNELPNLYTDPFMEEILING